MNKIKSKIDRILHSKMKTESHKEIRTHQELKSTDLDGLAGNAEWLPPRMAE